ncbi:MAG: FAD-binding oxidoreductase [Betaproteobacteria bacterium]|nr:FAD-binding oxidoreductase [Betaproteobacteria bacterium]
MNDPVFAQSFWYASAPVAPVTQALEGEVTADVAIVGAGYTGLSCALYLAEAGARAVVLESGEIGSGASGRNNGQVIPTFSRIEPDALVASTPAEQGGRAKGEELVQLVADSATFTFDLIRKHGMDCDAVQRGWVQPAHTPGRVQLAEQRVAAWARRGAAVELLDRSGIERVTGSRFWHGGWMNRSGGCLQPLAYCRELARVAMAKGALVFTGSRATSVSRQGTRWRVSTAAGGAVLAERVVIATHAYSNGLWPGLARTVFPVNSYQMATVPLPEDVQRSLLPGAAACSDTQGDLHFFRLSPEGRLVTGGGLVFQADYARRLRRRIGERVARVFPRVGIPDFDFVWHGAVGVTLDSRPHAHELAPGVLAWVGCNGRGVALATCAGAHFARACLGTPLAQLPLPFSPLAQVVGHAIGKRIASFALALFRWRDKQEYRP